MDELFALASRLRAEHAAAGERVSFTHVPVQLSPAAVLVELRESHLAPIVAPEHSRLTHPERPWYGPVQLIRASADLLAKVRLTASTWDPPTWTYHGAELTIALVYERDGNRAQQQLSLHEAEGGPTLTRVFYDEQRAETGYEGDDRLTVVPTAAQVIDFLRIVSDCTRST